MNTKHWKHIAFCVFTVVCGALEIAGVGAGALWVLVVIWALSLYV